MATELLLIECPISSVSESTASGNRVVQEILRSGKDKVRAAEWMVYQTPDFMNGLFVLENLAEMRAEASRFFREVLPSGAEGDCRMFANAEALYRYFDVLLGLTSAIPGNSLFLENMKEGYTLSLENGTTGAVLNRLFQTGVAFYRKMQSQSPIFQGADSIPAAIVELGNKIFGAIRNQRVGILGRAPEATPLLRFLRSQNIPFLEILSDTLPQSEAQTGVDIFIRVSDLELPAGFHRWISAQLKNRPYKPILFVDLTAGTVAFPEAETFLVYKKADLEVLVQHNYAERKKAAVSIRPHIENEVRNFLSWLYSQTHFEFSGLIGRSRGLVRVLEMVARVSNSDVTILIEGESGTGKELIAKAIHKNSLRAKKPFVVVNSAAIPDTLLESELFGHVKGAFSGAIFSKKGLFEEADQGTIFLDEIGEMSPSTQAKILRVLQSGEIRPVGSTATRRVNVRLIAATNKNLASLVQAGKFREDLYYRLKVLHILVPPLRERPEDIEELAYYFLEKYSQALGKHLTAISPEVLALIRAYPWPGNVRELENAIERAVVMTIGQRLTPTDLPEEIQFYAGAEKSEGKDWPTLQELERQHILRTLNHVDWNLGQATELLGISRATLWRKLKAYGIPQKNTA